MMRYLTIAAVLALVPATGQPADPAPWQMVRALEALLNQTARPGLDTRREAEAERVRIAEAFERADPGVWSDPRNARAALVYVLAGGSPRILVTFGTLDPPPPVDPKLVTGTIAHVSGRSGVARELFAATDYDALPTTLAAHVALAQATLVMADDPEGAQRNLALARTLMPGTLIAEGAARREIRALARLEDRDRFISLVHRYFRTWSQSIYAPEIRNDLAVLWFQINAPDLRKITDRLGTLAGGLPEPMTAALYTEVSRRSLVAGELTLAADVARLAAEAGDDPVQQARATIYGVSADLKRPDFGAVMESIEAIDPAGLDRTDQAIRMAALHVGTQVMDPTPIDLQEEPDGDEPGNPVAARAAAAVEEVDAMLGGDSN